MLTRTSYVDAPSLSLYATLSRYDQTDLAVHSFTPEKPVVHDVKELLGPVYDVLNQHHYRDARLQ